MAVLNTTVTRAKPGRGNDAVAMAVEAAKLIERHGVPSSRLLGAISAGEASFTHVFTTEFENNEAYGAYMDETDGDAEFQSLLDRVLADDSPVTIEQQSLAVEIPLDRESRRGHGSFVEAYVSRALPGRFDAALDLARHAFDFVEGQGGMNARLLQLTLAGSMTDALVATWEFESLRALGRAGDAYARDPAGLEIMAMLTGSSSPVTMISSGLYAEIPM